MTIKLSEESFSDRMLKPLGKKRGVIVPKAPYQEYGPYAYATAQKESFWKALLRPKGAPLPEGLVDLDEWKEIGGDSEKR
jgi:hypothetical protein